MHKLNVDECIKISLNLNLKSQYDSHRTSTCVIGLGQYTTIVYSADIQFVSITEFQFKMLNFDWKGILNSD